MDEFYNSERNKNTQLSELLKPTVWVIEFSGTIRGIMHTVFATGFSVSDDGLVMTCAHTFRGMSEIEIKARKLSEEKFEIAKLKCERPKWDLALLKVNDVVDCTVAEFVDDGSIWEGQPLLHIGNSFNFVGSYLVGHACFPCVGDATPLKNNQTCGTYISRALESTPAYRVMGDVWNKEYFERSQNNRFPFEKSLAPSVPIIQCNGLNAGPGCSGGPLFNMEGKVVGLLVGEADGYAIGIHVAALKFFFSDATSESEDTSKKRRTC